MLFQLGPVTFDCPAGLNATGTAEEFGGDFAVKAVVGAQQPREFVGASDRSFSLSGDLFPYAAARAGQDTGLDDIETLRGIATSGDPQILVRGDGENLGWFLVEKVTQTATALSATGIGRKIGYTVKLVESPTAADQASTTGVLAQLFG